MPLLIEALTADIRKREAFVKRLTDKVEISIHEAAIARERVRLKSLLPVEIINATTKPKA